jgi:BirA family transcriptional regulator, biotin operon repressor / biotin---[acetyl-CoA-carboxylase] ligase
VRALHEAEIDFPPLLTGHAFPATEPPLRVACEGAAAGRFGAGDVIWSLEEAHASLAIVLEPDVPLARALEMLPLGVVACGDCLAALAPPKVAITFGWPGIVYANEGAVAQLSAAVDRAASAEAVPNWLAVGLEVRLTGRPGAPEPGDDPSVTTLAEEGCPDLTAEQLIGSYTRHFLTWLDTWTNEGFAPVHQAWEQRADKRVRSFTDAAGGGVVSGAFVGLDEHGNLVLKRDDGKHVSLRLLDAVARWPQETALQ